MLALRKSFWLLPFFVVILVLNQNCSGPKAENSEVGAAPVPVTPTPAPSDASSSSDIQVTKLSESSYAIGGESFPYQLLKLSSSDGSVAYAHWVPPRSDGGPSPAVLVTEPYSGINWSDNSVDQTWAQRPNASTGYLFADVDGPGYVAGVSSSIQYQLVPPEYNMAIWYPLLKNGIGLLVVSGRFYAGGSLLNPVQSMIKGLRFLSKEPKVDRSRVGIFGISLGGFEAIYAAGMAPADIQPQFGVAWAPPTDWQVQANYSKAPPVGMTDPGKVQAFQSFFDPYLRRMKVVTQGLPGEAGANFSSLMPSAFLTQFKTQFLILHDDWDTLVPVSQSRSLVSALGSKAEGLWYPHGTAINYNTFALDHQQSSEGLIASTGYLFTYAYFIDRLITNPSSGLLYLMYNSADTSKQFTYFRQQQVAGKDVSSLLPRLIDLSDSRLYLIEVNGGPSLSGAQYVASVLQTYWGLSPAVVNSTNVKSYLQSQGLPH